jgi:hypothetical protein
VLAAAAISVRRETRPLGSSHYDDSTQSSVDEVVRYPRNSANVGADGKNGLSIYVSRDA